MRGQPSLCEIRRPKSLAEALEWLGREPDLRPIAGGTDLMVPFAAGTLKDTRFLNLWGLPELRGIEVSDRTLILGALTTYTDIRNHPLIAEVFPNLVRSAEVTGAPAIQNRGTLGGNLVNGSPAGDSLPSLLAYDADVELRSTKGARWVSYAAFHTGYKRNLLQPGELLTRILLRKPEAGAGSTLDPREGMRSRGEAHGAKHRPQGAEQEARPEGPDFHYFRKVGTRAAQAIAKVSLALHAQVKGGQLSSFRLALGAVAPIPLRAAKVETLLRGEALEGLRIRDALAALQEDIAPIDDIRSTAQYRRRVAANLLEEALNRLSREHRD